MSMLSLFSRSFRISPALSRRLAGAAVALGVTTLMSSCGSGLYPLDPPALQARGLQPGEGYIVATFKGQVYDGKSKLGVSGPVPAEINMKGSGTAQGTYASLVPFVMPVNRSPFLAGGGSASEEIAIPVPAGNYEITDWRITGNGSSGPVAVLNRKPMKVPFQVKAGEATYVGSYLALVQNGRNLFGFRIMVDGIILAEDKFASDQAAIAKKYPSIKKDRIRRSDAAKTYMSEMKRISERSGFLGLF